MIQKRYVQIYNTTVAIERWVLLWYAQWCCFLDFPPIEKRVKTLPAWAATSPSVSRSQWTTATDFPMFIPLQSRERVYCTAQVKTCILSLTRKQLSECPWKKRQHPVGCIDRVNHLPTAWYLAIAKDGLDWSDSTLIPVKSDNGYNYSLLS